MVRLQTIFKNTGRTSPWLVLEEAMPYTDGACTAVIACYERYMYASQNIDVSLHPVFAHTHSTPPCTIPGKHDLTF